MDASPFGRRLLLGAGLTLGVLAPAAQPPSRPLDGVRAPLGGGGIAPIGDTPPPSAYQTQHEFTLTQLASNTTDDVFVAATTQSGRQLSAQTRFSTLKQRVRITLREIDIREDGDWGWSNGEPAWLVKAGWPGGAVFGCYPNTDIGDADPCQFGSFADGRIHVGSNR